jgi:hypothetical protein
VSTTIEGDERERDQYDTLLRAMEAGLRISLNGQAPNQPETAELRVLRSPNDKTVVEAEGTVSGDQYRIHRDTRGELVYSRVDDDGLSYEGDVTTIDIIGC